MTQPGGMSPDVNSRSSTARERPTQRLGLRLLKLAIVLTIMTVVVLALMPAFNTERYSANRVYCASNMRQIGQAIAMYANDHGGRFPDDLESVVANEDVSADLFVCPSSNDTPSPPGPTTQATAAALLQPGHCSYIYLGKGLTDQAVTPDMVLLYEPLANHGGGGMNVMFGDFHVEWMPASDAQGILNQVAARTTPVRFPTTLPTSAGTRGR